MSKYKYLEEKAKKLGKELLIEEWEIKNFKKLEVFEKPILIESTEGEKYEALAVLKKVPISKYTENLNNRIYSKKLFEEIKKRGEGNVSACLAGHPKDEGNPRDIVAIWHGLIVEEDAPKSDLYIIDEKLLKAVKGGLPIGVSTVGFGEIDPLDGKTVIAESYSLERHGDWVLNPSQQIYATNENLNMESSKDNKIKENQEKQEENIQKIEQKTNILETDNTNKYEESVEKNENKQDKEVLKMDKIQEAQFKNMINEQVSRAKKNDNLFEALGDLKAIDTADNIELKEKVDSTISEIQSKIANKENELKEAIDVKENELKDLNEKYEGAVKIADELKEKLNKVSTFIEQVVETEDNFNAEVFVENYNVLKEDHEKVEKMFENENFKKYEITSLVDFQKLVEDTIKRDADIEYLKEQIDILEKELSKSKSDKKFKEQLEKAEAHIVECEEKLEKLGFEFEEAEDKDDKEKDDDSEKEDDEKEMDEKKKSKKVKEKDDEMDDGDEKEMDEKKKSKNKESVIKYKFNQSNVESFVEETDEDGISEKLQEKIENDRIAKEINTYYENQVEKFPRLADFKDEIITSKSLIEAVNKVDELKDRNDEIISFKEVQMSQRPNWIKKGRI